MGHVVDHRCVSQCGVGIVGYENQSRCAVGTIIHSNGGVVIIISYYAHILDRGFCSRGCLADHIIFAVGLDQRVCR